MKMPETTGTKASERRDLFHGLSNHLGPLAPSIVSRLRAVLHEPCMATWDDAYTIIIRSRDMLSLWQAVIAVDPTFPRKGRSTDSDGNIVSDWARVPDSITIARALKYAQPKVTAQLASKPTPKETA